MSRIPHQKTLAAASMLVAVGLATAGCSSSSAAQPAAEPTSTANPEECNQPALDALYEKAQEEDGAVLLYYTSPPEQIAPVQAAFTEAFPEMTLEYGQVTGLGVAARIIQELDAGRTSADIGWAATPELLQMQDRGFTTDFDAEELGLVNPDIQIAPDGLVISTSPSVLVYNTDLVAEDDVPNTWEELAAGTWDGGLGLWQFPYSFAGLASTLGEDTVDGIVSDLSAKQPFLYQSNFPLAADVGAGKIEIGVGRYHTTIPTIDSGAPVEMKLIDPVPVDSQVAYLVNDSPHPNSAKLFFAWALCGDGARVLESSTNVGNALVPGTETAAMFEGLEVVEWGIDEVDTLNRLLKKYGDQLAAGGVAATP